MAILNLIEQLQKVEKRIGSPEQLLGKTLNQPFCSNNSSSRKIMYNSQQDQIIPVRYAEVPLIQTGFEDEFGRHSSSFIVTDKDYDVVAKIPKFEHCPEQQYILVLKSTNSNQYTIVERKEYHHKTESYGYLMNTELQDKLYLGSTVKAGTVIEKSMAFDECNNRRDGVNLTAAYMTLHKTTEDGIVISESGAKKLTSPLIKKVTIIINDNDIPLNLYGNDEVYKSMPDVGEYVKNGILCGLRREKKEESLFSLAYNRLQDILISDEKFTVSGRVVDLNIACNNPQGLSKSYYNSQLYYYYNNLINYSKRIINVLKDLINNPNVQCSYELKKLYLLHERILKGDPFRKDKPFSNVLLEIFLIEDCPLSVGDKVTDRYGGKGVISAVVPDHLMPLLDNGERVEIIFNSIGPVGRQNPGQLFEVSLNFISSRIVERFSKDDNVDYNIQQYLDYMNLVCPSQSNYMKRMLLDNKREDFEKLAFIDSLHNGICISLKPISESIDIDKLAQIYNHFTYLNPCELTVPIYDSNGNVRYTTARRPLYCGKKYIYRLKQYAEEKFSSTSLSSTNIRNEPAKPKTNKIYKAPYSKTPIRFGEMETGDMLHFLNPLIVVENLMIHSASPQGRRLCEKLLTDDPFNVNIELDLESKNRNVEILNAYLKTMGLRLIFTKNKKKLTRPFLIKPFTVPTQFLTKPFHIAGPGESVIKPFTIESSNMIRPFVIVPFNIEE